MGGKVTAIIPVYNRPALLRRAVNSVRAQTYSGWEVIVVDDGSTDETAEVASRLAEEDRRIRIVHQSNAGPGVARETGRSNARGEFIQYLDSDDVLLPNKFTDQIAALERAPECDVAYGTTRLVDSDGKVLADPLKGTGTDQAYLFPRLLRERWWSTHTPLFRRRLCDRVGPWSNMRFCEDWDYDARVGSLRAKLVNCRQHVSHTTRHEGDRLTGGGLSPEKLADMARLLVTLDRCAREAGVPAEAAEWGYFRRWLFLEARRTAACGLLAESDQLLGLLARHQDHTLRPRVTFYKTLRRLLGARLAARLYDILADTRRSGPGSAASASPTSGASNA